MSIRYFLAGVLSLLVAGCSAGDARMSALRTDMAGRQAAAELAASRPDAKPEDRERARAYASAQSCVDQIQAHSRSVQAASMAANAATAAVGFAGPGGALAARAMGPMHGTVLRNQGEFRVACY